MAVAVRAFLPIVMLAGSYVPALVRFAVGIALAVWVTTVTTGFIGAKVGVAVFLGTVWAVGHGTWKALRGEVSCRWSPAPWRWSCPAARPSCGHSPA